ncbi:MAG: hypothetical protein ACE5FF_14400, partial [Saprospiraceae bacterium]
MNSAKMKLLLIISFLLPFCSCSKDDVIINNTDDFEQYIQDEMDAQKIPALSALIFKEDQIIYEKYFGKANLEQDIAL